MITTLKTWNSRPYVPFRCIPLTPRRLYASLFSYNLLFKTGHCNCSCKAPRSDRYHQSINRFNLRGRHDEVHAPLGLSSTVALWASDSHSIDMVYIITNRSCVGQMDEWSYCIGDTAFSYPATQNEKYSNSMVYAGFLGN